MYTRSCLSDAVHFEMHGPIHNIVYCHCSQCRKAQSSAYASNGNALVDQYKLCSGESSPWTDKMFLQGMRLADYEQDYLDNLLICH